VMAIPVGVRCRWAAWTGCRVHGASVVGRNRHHDSSRVGPLRTLRVGSHREHLRPQLIEPSVALITCCKAGTTIDHLVGVMSSTMEAERSSTKRTSAGFCATWNSWWPQFSAPRLRLHRCRPRR